MPNKNRDAERRRRERRRSENAAMPQKTALGSSKERTKPRPVHTRLNRAAVLAFALIVAAAALLVFLFVSILTRDNSLAVYLNSTRIGVVALSRRDPVTEEYLLNLVLARLSDETGARRVVTADEVTVENTRSRQGDIVTVEFLVSRLAREIRVGDSFQVEASAIHVDGVIEAIVINHREAENVLRRIYRHLSETGSDATFGISAFAQTVEIIPIVTIVEYVADGDTAYVTLMREREDRWYYTVQSGDTLIGIARDHQMSEDDIFRLNPQHVLNPDIWPGNRILVAQRRTLLTLR